MRVLFLVPTEQHKVTAGSRIRYDRLKEKSEYFDLSVQSMEGLTAADLDACEVCIFSKTYTAGAVAIAHTLRRRGKIVGVDFFDDYFSQVEDPRLIRFRTWLKQAAEVFQFALCSTPVMQDILSRMVPHLPVHVVADPYAEIDAQAVGAAVSAKLERVRVERVIDVLWFGIGSNPFFPVGLHDLAAYSWSLAELASGLYAVRLQVLTDDTSLTAGNLARLKRLPVPYKVDTWSIEAERQALERAFVSFIPVNGQSFSRAKSPNRALTAISAATQVLSPGFPLYRDLDAAVYTQAHELLADIADGACRIRPQTIDMIKGLVSELSSLNAILLELFLFLTKQHRSNRVEDGVHEPPRQAVVFGIENDRLIVKAGPAAGVLSVKSPAARAERVYDIRIDHAGGRQLDVYVKPEHVHLLAVPLRNQLSLPAKVGKARMVKVQADEYLLLDRAPALPPAEFPAVFYETAAYRDFLADIVRVCGRVFPTLRFIVFDLAAYSSADPLLPQPGE